MKKKRTPRNFGEYDPIYNDNVNAMRTKHNPAKSSEYDGCTPEIKK